MKEQELTSSFETPMRLCVLLASEDHEFARKARLITGLSLPSAYLVVGMIDRRTIVAMPQTPEGDAGLLLTFFNVGTETTSVTPTLVTSDPRAIAPWRTTPFNAEGAIDALNSLLLRRVIPPTGNVQ